MSILVASMGTLGMPSILHHFLVDPIIPTGEATSPTFLTYLMPRIREAIPQPKEITFLKQLNRIKISRK